jgi:hypothetical protein
MPRSHRWFHVLTGTVMIVGSLVYLWGGAQHPAAGTNLGPLGSEQYWRSFAEHIASHPNWAGIHTGILLGPLLWLLGAGSLIVGLWSEGEVRLTLLGTTALAVGTALWAVAFSFDGFVAPDNAAAVVRATATDMAAMLNQLRSTQNAVIRLGLVSWTLIGVGMAALSAGLLATSLLGAVPRRVLGVTGLLLGLWPALAWAARIYFPGPFISPLWVPNAVLTGLWFMAAGVAVISGLRPVRGDHAIASA